MFSINVSNAILARSELFFFLNNDCNFNRIFFHMETLHHLIVLFLRIGNYSFFYGELMINVVTKDIISSMFYKQNA